MAVTNKSVCSTVAVYDRLHPSMEGIVSALLYVYTGWPGAATSCPDASNAVMCGFTLRIMLRPRQYYGQDSL